MSYDILTSIYLVYRPYLTGEGDRGCGTVLRQPEVARRKHGAILFCYFSVEGFTAKETRRDRPAGAGYNSKPVPADVRVAHTYGNLKCRV